MRTRSGLVAWIVAVALAAPRGAIAQPSPAEPSAEVRARALYEEGDRFYAAAAYDEAIARFEAAYAIAPEPLFLYDIALAYRKKGACAEAQRYYEAYLRAAPEARNRRKVEERIAEMKACAAPIASAPVAAPAPRATTPARGPVLAAPGPARAAGGRIERIAGLATVGVGIALVGAGAWFAHGAAEHADRIEGLCPPHCDASADPILAEDRAGRADQRNAVIAFTAGGIAVVGGATLYWLGWRRGDARVSVAPAPRGAVVGASLRF